MLIEIILFLVLVIFAGTITGLIPGIHINLIGAILVSLSVTLFYSVNPIYIIVLIVAMAITHTFVDFIPSVFLGCPDTDTELSVLPGHELLKQGEGYEAILLTCYGSLAAIFILVLIFIPSVFIISKTRTGAAVAVQQILGSLSLNILIFILGVILISGIISFFLTIFLAKFFSQKIEKVNYTYISLATLLLLVIVVFLFSGLIGLAVLIAATFTGIYSISLGVRRTNMMGCLMIPTIIFYLF